MEIDKILKISLQFFKKKVNLHNIRPFTIWKQSKINCPFIIYWSKHTFNKIKTKFFSDLCCHVTYSHRKSVINKFVLTSSPQWGEVYLGSNTAKGIRLYYYPCKLHPSITYLNLNLSCYYYKGTSSVELLNIQFTHVLNQWFAYAVWIE